MSSVAYEICARAAIVELYSYKEPNFVKHSGRN